VASWSTSYGTSKTPMAIIHPFYEFLAKEFVEQMQIKDFWNQVEIFWGLLEKSMCTLLWPS
jgi:hypothetical protein